MVCGILEQTHLNRHTFYSFIVEFLIKHWLVNIYE